ncbi:MAG TPA: RsmG family class I SAM-dependent methyltransferase [Polyangiaceae bacterium]|nr:RsmG family class I SAM-dependent methyltransferase [Polyangiaceae bacterium]
MDRRPERPAAGWPIREVLASLSLPAPGTEILASIARWLDRLAEWNAKMDLTAAKDGAALAWLMLADAAELAGELAPNVSIVDVGTGAGAPGLGLALLRPDLHVTLVEPLRKRVAFLRTVLGELRRSDVTLLEKRGESLEPGVFDEAVSRATLAPDEWLALGTRLVRPGGGVWVLLAQGAAPEAPGCALDRALEYATPSGGRRLLRYARRT